MVWLVGIIALIVGFIIGWWWANRSFAAQRAELEATWQGRLDEATAATEAAKADATAARKEADLAKAETEQAHDDAKAAESARDAALEDASAAKTAAESAQADAEAARSEAASAKSDAEAARAAAEKAETDAEAARSEADAALGELEAAKGQAEQARSEAEATKTELEAARSHGEQARADAEAARTAAESARTEAESAQAEVAAARTEADAANQQAQSARAEADEAVGFVAQPGGDDGHRAGADDAATGDHAEVGGDTPDSGAGAGTAKTGMSESATPPSTDSGKPDDLTTIEGVGPKIAGLLADAGFPTFATVAGASFDDLRAALDAGGSRYRMHDPTSWPQQAALAAEGKWDELTALQDSLSGGR